MQGLPATSTHRSEAATQATQQALRGVATESRSPLSSGQTANAQVISSEAAREGQGYRVQVQLTSGEQLTLRMDRPLAEGQTLQLTGRGEQQVDLRLTQPAAQLQQVTQQLNQLMSQLPGFNARPATSSSLPLTPGQNLFAQVTGSQSLPATTTQPAGSQFQVQLLTPSGQHLTLITDRPLQPGQQVQVSRLDSSLNLEIKPLSQQATQLLSYLQALQPAATQTSSRSDTSLQSLLQAASAQLRQALPRQAPLQQPLQQLSQLVRQLPSTPPASQPPITPSNLTSRLTAALTTSSAPASHPAAQSTPSLREHLTSLLQLIPQGNRPPSAQQLQTFIPFSGLLLEANLVRGVQTSAQQGDLKLLLQQASAQLRASSSTANNPSQQQLNQQVQQQLQTAQARIQVLQQASLQATQSSYERGQPGQILQMDLPYSVRGEWFQAQLEIRRWINEKDAEAAAEEASKKTRSWEVQLSFDLKNWGKLHTRLKLTGVQLKADLWIEAAESFAAFQQETELLEARLRRLGAEVESFTCHLGKPPETRGQRSSEQIIDTEI